MALIKKLSFLISILVALLWSVCIIYYFLLHSDFFSINAIIASTQHLALDTHLLMLGFLPIYISFVIFGSGISGLYLGSRLHFFLKTMLK